MNINNMVQQFFEKASLAYKKPIKVKIEGPMTEPKMVASLENTEQIARIGDYIVTGINGEQYPIGPAVFTEYEVTSEQEPHLYRKKKKIIHAYKVDFKGEIETVQGSVLYFEPGYYIVMQSPTDAWAVAGEIFEATYEFVK